MKGLILLMTFLVKTCVAADIMKELINYEYTIFKSIANKHYSPTEDTKRKKIYIENRNRIMENNKRYRNGESTYLMNINEMTDKSKSEIILTNGHLGIVLKPGIVYNSTKTVKTSVDWRTSGRVTSVKNQGSCGCCFAIATVGAMEGQLPKVLGQLFSLSFQNIIDCSRSFGNYGCDGGLMTNSYKYLMNGGGLEHYMDYSYTGEEGACMASEDGYQATVSNYYTLPAGNETILQSAVEFLGPVAAAVDSSQMSMSFYSSGVYNDPNCSKTSVNHAILIVGHGVTTGLKKIAYWIIKNSWGVNWGEEGYIRLIKGYNACGISNLCSVPIVSKYSFYNQMPYLQSNLKSSLETTQSTENGNDLRSIIIRNSDFNEF